MYTHKDRTNKELVHNNKDFAFMSNKTQFSELLFYAEIVWKPITIYTHIKGDRENK